ncbi:MAG: archaellin/type IV pilin N-terminal domain-containing protein, partial [Nitrososphaerales archaeon]
MNSRLFRRRKRGVSEVIGTVILFAMIFSVAFGLFYFVGQDQQFYQQAQKSNAALISQQNSEHLSVYGISSGGNLGFYVNNTGIALSIVSFWIFNGSSSIIVQY